MTQIVERNWVLYALRSVWVNQEDIYFQLCLPLGPAVVIIDRAQRHVSVVADTDGDITVLCNRIGPPEYEGYVWNVWKECYKANVVR